MSAVFILFVVAYTKVGAVVTMQEFSSEQSCKAAETFVASNLSDFHETIINTKCLPK